MRAVAKRPGEPGKVITIDNDLKALQDYVGGYIETIRVFEDALIICNEEGRLLGLPFNLSLCGMVFFGPVLFVGVEGEEFTDCPNAGWLMDQINVCNGY